MENYNESRVILLKHFCEILSDAGKIRHSDTPEGNEFHSHIINQIFRLQKMGLIVIDILEDNNNLKEELQKLKAKKCDHPYAYLSEDSKGLYCMECKERLKPI